MAIKQRWYKTKPIRLTTEEALANILPLFKADSRILIAYLFGSRVNKEDMKNSDIDLAIYTTGQFQWKDYYLIYSEITKTLHSDRVDLVWLNHAEPILSFEILKTSKVVFYRDPDMLNDYELKVKKISILRNTGSLERVVYRKESLIRRIEKLREYKHDLKEFGELSFNEYLKDKKIKYSIERLLFLIAENILDFLDHILSSQHETLSDSYEEIIENAYKIKLIDDYLFSQLKGLGGFRNVLAYEYLSLSDEEVYRNYKKILSIIEDIIDAFERLI